MSILRREIHPQVKVIDERQGVVEYIASNETLDAHNEIVRADGWLFDDFSKNAPFVDSHNYESVGCCLGKVLDFKVQKKQLVETVKWAIDAGLPEDHLANIGFKLTAAGYLKAVSVGFMPVNYVTPYDRNQDAWREQCEDLGLNPDESMCRCIYVQQQQKELSACIIGANPDAVTRAYKAGILDDAIAGKLAQRFPEFGRKIERAAAPTRRTAYSFSSGKSSNAVNEMIVALGGKPTPADPQPKTRSHMINQTQITDFSRTCEQVRDAFKKLECVRGHGGNQTEIEQAVRAAFTAMENERKHSFGDPVVRYLNAKSERRFFWNGVFRILAGKIQAESREFATVQRAVSGILPTDTFGGTLLENIPVADEVWDLVMEYGAYKRLGLRRMVGAFTIFPQMTSYPNAVFITPDQQGQTTIPEDTSLLGSFTTPQANTIATLITCSKAWLDDERVDLSEVLLTKMALALAGRIDYGCFQGNGNDDQNNGETTGLFLDQTVKAYQTDAGRPQISQLIRQDFVNVTALVAPAALQRMETLPPRWYISPVLIPQLLALWDDQAKHYLLKTPAETGGEWLLVGFPVTWATQAPSAVTPLSKIAVFGNPDAYLVALHDQFEITMSTDSPSAMQNIAVQFRALARGRSMMRNSAGFATLQLA